MVRQATWAGKWARARRRRAVVLPEPAKATTRNEPAGSARRPAMMAACSGLGCRELSNGTYAAGRRIERSGPTARGRRSSLAACSGGAAVRAGEVAIEVPAPHLTLI